jgi:hypothetical protein
MNRIKQWVSEEILTHTDLNAEFDNIINNFTPSDMSSQSEDLAEMRTVMDPYPASSPDNAANLAEEIQQLRYMIAQITGNSYWYQDATGSITSILAMPRVKIGSFTRDTSLASGDVSYTGIGFTPTAIMFMSYESAQYFGTGFDDGTTHAQVFSNNGTMSRAAASSIFFGDSGSNYSSAFIKSFDADGFTLTYSKTGSPTGTGYVEYMAFR